MSSGRYVPRDPFAPTSEPRFRVVRDMCRQVLEYEPLPIGADLRAAFESAIAQMKANGWTVEKPWKWSHEFYCTKDGRRVSVEIGGDPYAKGNCDAGFAAGMKKTW